MPPPFHFKMVEDQLHELATIARWLDPQYAEEMSIAGHIPVTPDTARGYTGILAVPKMTNFGIFQIPTSNEAWEKKIPLPLRTSIRGLERGMHNDFDTTQFTLHSATSEAILRMKQVQARPDPERSNFDNNRIRVFQVRVCTDPQPELRDGEFFLDLASHLWLLITHTNQALHKRTMLFRCRGETCRGSDVIVGYWQGQRIIDTGLLMYRDCATPTIIGYAPY